MSRHIDRFDPRTQLPPVLIRNPKSTFFSTTFAGGGEEFFDTEIAEWDHDVYRQPVARYAGEDITVEPTERSTFKVNEIMTPKLQERRIITGSHLKKRAFGENAYSPNNVMARLAALQAEDLEFCADAVDNLIELQWAQFMTAGIIPIVGDGVDRVLDYGFENKEVLTGGERWGQTGVDILDSMRRICDKLAREGHAVDEIYMAPDVWKALYSNETIQKLLDLRRFEMGEIAPEKIVKYGAAKPVGVLTDPWVTLYTQNSTIPGTTTPHLPPGTVMYVSPDAKRNKIGFGAHMWQDPDGQWHWAPGRYIQEFHKEARPPREETLVTSRAMPIPFDMRSWYVQKVL